MTNEAIAKIDASVRKLHGGDREQASKYRSFMAWQLAQREQSNGLDPSPILKRDTE